jgi:hypothetical protein
MRLKGHIGTTFKCVHMYQTRIRNLSVYGENEAKAFQKLVLSRVGQLTTPYRPDSAAEDTKVRHPPWLPALVPYRGLLVNVRVGKCIQHTGDIID